MLETTRGIEDVLSCLPIIYSTEQSSDLDENVKKAKRMEAAVTTSENREKIR